MLEVDEILERTGSLPTLPWHEAFASSHTPDKCWEGIDEETQYKVLKLRGLDDEPTCYSLQLSGQQNRMERTFRPFAVAFGNPIVLIPENETKRRYVWDAGEIDRTREAKREFIYHLQTLLTDVLEHPEILKDPVIREFFEKRGLYPLKDS